MAFEESPRLDGSPRASNRSVRGWIARHARLLMVLAALFLLADLLIAAYFYLPGMLKEPPGGLDGCLVGLDQSPIQATVKVGKITTAAGLDGCFFLPELPPGSQPVEITPATGDPLLLQVTILSGEAVSLGAITVH